MKLSAIHFKKDDALQAIQLEFNGNRKSLTAYSEKVANAPLERVAIDPNKKIKKFGAYLSQNKKYIWGLKLLDA